MATVKVYATDGRYLINYPDCIIIFNNYDLKIFVDIADWNKFTGNAKVKPYIRGQQLNLTKELVVTLKKVSLQNPQNTNNTIPSDLKENTCPRCGGLGKIEVYSHINNGICFECNGTGQL